MDEKTKINLPNVGCQLGFFNTLFLVFLVLKLTNVIAWSWWWITAPLWIPALTTFVLILVISGIVVFCESKE